ncbi:MAG: hypothetical protein WCS73_01060 [Lentisphaeria bacterium]
MKKGQELYKIIHQTKRVFFFDFFIANKYKKLKKVMNFILILGKECLYFYFFNRETNESRYHLNFVSKNKKKQRLRMGQFLKILLKILGSCGLMVIMMLDSD